jgi:hypothetical protein
MCKLTNNSEILLKTTRFSVRGDEKWPMNKFLAHKTRSKTGLIIKV